MAGANGMSHLDERPPVNRADAVSMKLLSALLSLLVLASCHMTQPTPTVRRATPVKSKLVHRPTPAPVAEIAPPRLTAKRVAKGVVEKVDEFTGVRTTRTVTYGEKDYRRAKSITYFCRQIESPDGRRFRQIYVTMKDNSWLFLDRAVVNRRKLGFREIDTRVGHGGTIYEDVAITLDKQLVNEIVASKGPFRIGLYGKKGNTVLEVEPEVVRGFMTRINANGQD